MSTLPTPQPDDRGRRRAAAPGPAPRPVAALVADQVGVGLWLVDETGRTLYANDSLCGWAGDVRHLDQLADWLPGVPLARYVARVRRGDGPVEEPAVLLRQAGDPGRLMELRLETGPVAGSILIALRDVTDRARVQRLGALVETAVGLGHEIANPMAILRGELELLEGELRAALPVGRIGTVRSRLASILRAADRVDQVLRRLRKLAEPASTAYLASRGARMIDLEGLESSSDDQAPGTAGRRPPARPREGAR